jgi:hypothetical protein
MSLAAPQRGASKMSLNETPMREILGPYLSTDANVRTTKTRGMCYFPYEMLEPLLGTDLTARHFELIVPELVDSGLEATFGDLINFLTIALVEPSLTRKETWTLQYQAKKNGYVPGPMVTSYRREHVLYRDLPGLRPGSTAPTMSDPALVDVDMVAEAEARSEWIDRLDNREEAHRSLHR